jgi:hypothetical protein
MTTSTLKELREKWEAADAVVRTIDPKPVSVSLTSIAAGEMAPWARAALGTCAADLRVHEAKAIAATALIAAYEARWGPLNNVAGKAVVAKIAAEAARDAATAAIERRDEIVRCARGLVRTAHPDVGRREVVPQWWTALVAALSQEDAE